MISTIIKTKAVKVVASVTVLAAMCFGMAATAGATTVDKNENEATVLEAAQLRELPTDSGKAVASAGKGETLQVYLRNVNGGWAAVLTEDNGLLYVEEDKLEYAEGWTVPGRSNEGDGQERNIPPYKYEYLADMTQPTGYTGEELEKVVAGTGLEGLGEHYADMEEQYSVSALFLLAITIQESGWGSSSLAKGQNNLGGLKDGGSGYKVFASKADCVTYMAEILSENYLTPGGKYYNGKTSKDVAQIYCVPPESWYRAVEDLMETCYEKIVEG